MVPGTASLGLYWQWYARRLAQNDMNQRLYGISITMAALPWPSSFRLPMPGLYSPVPGFVHTPAASPVHISGVAIFQLAISDKYYQTTGPPHNPSHPIRLPGKLPSVPTVYYPVPKMSQSRPKVHNPLLIRLSRTSSSTTCSTASPPNLCPHIDYYNSLTIS